MQNAPRETAGRFLFFRRQDTPLELSNELVQNNPVSTVAEIKEAAARLPERQKGQIARWMQTLIPDRLNDDEMMEIAAEGARAQEQQELESALRHSLRSPLKIYKPGHSASLASQNGRRKFGA